MLTTEQLEARRYSLGASEVAAVCGLNPWKSAHDVWLAKMGLAEPEESHATRIGTFIEPLILQLYREDTGAEVAHFGTMTHPTVPWAAATPDFCVGGVRRVGEIKLVGWRTSAHWSMQDDGIPDYYRPQVEWQMMVCGADDAHVAALLGTDFRIYHIERDAELAGMLLERATKFWVDHVLGKTPPRADWTDGALRMLKRLYPTSLLPMRPADPDVAAIVERLRVARADCARIERETALLENRMREAIGRHEGVFGRDWKATWKADKNGKRSFRFTDKAKGKEAA